MKKMIRVLTYEQFMLRKSIAKAIEGALNVQESIKKGSTITVDPITGNIDLKFVPKATPKYIETKVTILPTGTNFDGWD